MTDNRQPKRIINSVNEINWTCRVLHGLLFILRLYLWCWWPQLLLSGRCGPPWSAAPCARSADARTGRRWSRRTPAACRGTRRVSRTRPPAAPCPGGPAPSRSAPPVTGEPRTPADGRGKGGRNVFMCNRVGFTDFSTKLNYILNKKYMYLIMKL